MVKKIGYFARRRILRSVNFLDLTPMRLYSHEMDAQNNAVILVPRFQGFLSKRVLQPRLKNPYIKLELDELGTSTWLLLDGKLQVRDICRQIRELKGGMAEPVEDRVTRFLSQLFYQNLIVYKEILKPHHNE